MERERLLKLIVLSIVFIGLLVLVEVIKDELKKAMVE